MFDLEKAIGAWRQEMKAGGIENRPFLDELESHFREDIEKQKKAGLNDLASFENAVRNIGKAGQLKSEFEKISSTRERKQQRFVFALVLSTLSLMCLISAGALVFRYGVFSEMTSAERASGFAAVAVMMLFTFGGFPVIASRRVKDVIPFSGVALVTIWLFILYRLVLPRLVLTIGGVGLVALWGFVVPLVAVTVILFGLIAAQKKTMATA